MRPISRLTQRTRLAVIAGLSGFLVLGGSGVAIAAWTSAASVTGSVTAATASFTIEGARALDTQYAFAGDASRSPTIVRTLVVKNTGTSPLGYTLSLSGIAGNALAGVVTLTLWTSAGTCQSTGPGAGATNGTLASPPTLPSDALSAAPGASFTLCVSTSLNSTIAVSQGLTITPTLTITGTVGVSTWTASTPDAVFTQSVYRMANPTSLTCAQGKGDKTVILNWTAPVNYGSTGTLSYQVVDAQGLMIPSQPGGQATVTLASSDVNGFTQPFLVQAKENLYGSNSSGLPITLSQQKGGRLLCP